MIYHIIPYENTESDVLFVLLAERYEQRSTVITSNLAFSGWNQIFKDENDHSSSY